MRRVPSAVTVVTAAEAGTPHGVTIGSFTSASLNPPLISFNVGHEAQMHDLLVRADRFAVHLLSDAQAHLSEHFALPNRTGAEQFADLAYRLDAHGTPILAEVLTVFHCARYAVYPAGDHSLLVGEVLAVEEPAEGSPILYFDRTYRSVGKEAKRSLLAPVKRGSNHAL